MAKFMAASRKESVRPCSRIAVYDAESGQLMTATFVDYIMPRADNMPDSTSRITRCRA
jgi:hypothetical protein